MNKALFMRRIFSLAIILSSCYNAELSYGKENDLDEKKILEIKIIDAIDAIGKFPDPRTIEKFKAMALEKDKVVQLYSMKALYERGESSYLKSILQYLDDPDPRIRIETLKILSRIKNKAVFKRVLDIVKFDRDYFVRTAAVDALILVNARGFIDDLFEILDNIDKELNKDVIYAFSSLAKESDLPLLRQLSKDEDYALRIYCAEALARLGDASGIDILLNALDDKKNPFRLLAAEALRRLKTTDKAANRYLEELKSRDIQEKAMAIRILGMLSSESSLPAIIEHTRDKDVLIREKTAIALRDFKNRTEEGVFRSLLDLLEDDSEGVRLQAIISLGELYEKRGLKDIPGGSSKAEEAALKVDRFLNDSSKEIKAYAIRSLGLLEDKASILQILESFSDTDIKVREFAVEAVGRIKETSVAYRLVPLFDDSGKNVQIKAIEAAGLLGDKTLQDGVLKKLDSRDVDVVAAGLIADFRLGDPSAVKRCLEGIKEIDEVKRAASAKALGYMGQREEVTPSLVTALKDTSPSVRIASLESLKLLKDRSTLFDIVKLLGDRDKEVRVRACHTLKYLEDHRAVAALVDKL